MRARRCPRGHPGRTRRSSGWACSGSCSRIAHSLRPAPRKGARTRTRRRPGRTDGLTVAPSGDGVQRRGQRVSKACFDDSCRYGRGIRHRWWQRKGRIRASKFPAAGVSAQAPMLAVWSGRVITMRLRRTPRAECRPRKLTAPLVLNYARFTRWREATVIRPAACPGHVTRGARRCRTVR